MLATKMLVAKALKTSSRSLRTSLMIVNRSEFVARVVPKCVDVKQQSKVRELDVRCRDHSCVILSSELDAVRVL
jgi:hypothetical protein